MLKIILHKFFIISSFVLTVLGVYFAYLHYSLLQVDIQKRGDPLIQYSFVDDKKAFTVSGGNDIEIKEVVWTMPSVATSASSRLNKHPRILTVQDLMTQLYYDSGYLLAGLPLADRESFITCGILGGTYSFGIPLVAEVTFRQRGDEVLRTIFSLVYAELITSENPFISVYEESASLEEKENFTTQSLKELSKRFTAARDALFSHTLSSADNCKQG
ncbi:MAG: hypothetical protein Q8R36_04370 [bacterium]|nr:hypothetical protein [bacterium]